MGRFEKTGVEVVYYHRAGVHHCWEEGMELHEVLRKVNGVSGLMEFSLKNLDELVRLVEV